MMTKEKYKELIKNYIEKTYDDNSMSWFSFRSAAEYALFPYIRDNHPDIVTLNRYGDGDLELIYKLMDNDGMFDEAYGEVVGDYIYSGCLVSKDEDTWSFKNPNTIYNPKQEWCDVEKTQTTPLTGW